MARPDFKSNTPAVVHYDGTSRIQTVGKEQNVVFYKLLSTFGRIEMKEPVLANTSFNPNGEPIVEDAQDAILASVDLGLDILVVGNWVFDHF